MQHDIQPGKDRLENPRAFGDTPDPNEGKEEQPTPEEQMDYDLLVIRARKMMFGKGRENILQMLGGAETPAKGIGKVGATLVKSLVTASKAAGRKISPEAAINAGTEIAEDLNELAKANGVYQYDSKEEEQQQLEESILWGVKFYGDGALAAGEITPEMQQEAKAEMERGLREEQERGMKKKPLAAGVSQAMNKPGLVGSAMMKEGA